MGIKESFFLVHHKSIVFFMWTLITLVAAAIAAMACGGFLDPLSTTNSVLVVRVGFWDPVMMQDARKEAWPLCTEACVGQVLWWDTVSVSRVFSESSAGVFALAANVSKVVSVAIPVGLYTGECGAESHWRDLAVGQLQSMYPLESYSCQLFLYPANAGGGTCASSAGRGRGHGDAWVRFFDTPTVAHVLAGMLAGFPSCADVSDPVCNPGSVQLLPAARRVQFGWTKGLAEHWMDLTSPLSRSVVLASPNDILVGNVPSAFGGGGRVVIQWRSSHTSTVDVWMEGGDAVFVHWVQANGTVVRVARLAHGETLARLPGSPIVGLTVARVAVAVGDMTPILLAACEPAVPTVTVFPGNRTVTLVNNDIRCSPRSFVATAVGAPVFSCVNVTVVLVPDAHPREMSVHILDSAGKQLLQHSQTSFSTSAVTLLHCSELAQEVLQVVFQDTGSDGYCCDWGQGLFEVWANGRLTATGGRFSHTAVVPVTSAWQWYVP